MRNWGFVKKSKALLSVLIHRWLLPIPHISANQQAILLLLALFILALISFRSFPPLSTSSQNLSTEVVVEVSGEVRKPGVYLFEAPPTLAEALKRAGGLKEEAPLAEGPSSQLLQTGTLLIISKRAEELRIRIGRMEARKLLAVGIPLDLNRVSIEDLCLIRGIGDSLARRIVAYRQKKGSFQSVEELKEISGIGEEKWKEIRPFVYVGPPPCSR